MFVISAFEKRMQEAQEFKVSLSYIVNVWLHKTLSQKRKGSMYACTQASTHAGNLKCGQYTLLSDIIDFSFAQVKRKPTGWRG